MRRLQFLFTLLLLWLILVAFQLHYVSSTTFQETTGGRFKISTSAYDLGNTGSGSQKVMAHFYNQRNRKEAFEKKVRKSPSGPSPVGNSRPPSKA